jgi:hypothetical protein
LLSATEIIRAFRAFRMLQMTPVRWQSFFVRWASQLGRLVVDASEQALRREVRSFASDSERADIALVFYGGHGAQVNGDNYVLPVDMDVPRTETDIQLTGLKVDDHADRYVAFFRHQQHPSTNMRLSPPGRPGSPSLPGRSGDTLPHPFKHALERPASEALPHRKPIPEAASKKTTLTFERMLFTGRLSAPAASSVMFTPQGQP